MMRQSQNLKKMSHQIQFRYKDKSRTTARNPEQIIVCSGYLPGLERTLAHRGFSQLNCELIFERESEEREARYIEASFRSIFNRYKSWAALILDEEDLLGKDHPFVATLREYEKKYPYQITDQLTMNLW
jgi:hypothetical protein